MVSVTESFILGVLGLLIGAISMILSKFYKFKCSKIYCLGVSCIRDIDLENQDNIYEMEHNRQNRDVIPRRHSF
jgi:hypothetical protein